MQLLRKGVWEFVRSIYYMVGDGLVGRGVCTAEPHDLSKIPEPSGGRRESTSTSHSLIVR